MIATDLIGSRARFCGSNMDAGFISVVYLVDENLWVILRKDDGTFRDVAIETIRLETGEEHLKRVRA